MQHELVDLRNVKVSLFENKKVRNTVQKLYVQLILQRQQCQGSSNRGISCRVNLGGCGLWIYYGQEKERWGSRDEAQEKLPHENVFLVHRDLQFIDIVNYLVICGEL